MSQTENLHWRRETEHRRQFPERVLGFPLCSRQATGFSIANIAHLIFTLFKGGRLWSSNRSIQTSHHREIYPDDHWKHRIIGLCWLCTGRRKSGGNSVRLLLTFPSISYIYLHLPRWARNSIGTVLQNSSSQSFEEAKEEPRGGSRLCFQNPLNTYKTFRSICICKKLTKRKVTYNLTTL